MTLPPDPHHTRLDPAPLRQTRRLPPPQVNETGRIFRRWARISGAGNEAHRLARGARPTAQENTARSKQLNSYCGSVMERHEDALTEAILGGDVAGGSIDEYLCGTLVKACPPHVYQAEAADGGDAAAAALAAAEADGEPVEEEEEALQPPDHDEAAAELAAQAVGAVAEPQDSPDAAGDDAHAAAVGRSSDEL